MHSSSSTNGKAMFSQYNRGRGFPGSFTPSQFLIGGTLLLCCFKDDVVGSLDGDIAKLKHRIETGSNVSASENTLTISRELLSLIESNELTAPQFQNLTNYLISKNMIDNLFNLPVGFFGETVLSEAVKSVEVDTSTLQLLLQHGANFSAVDRNGNSALWYALRGKRSRKLLTDLIEVGRINIDHINRFGRSFLHGAAKFCHVEGVNFCLSHGLHVNALDYFWDTPLHKAVIFGRKGVLDTIGTLIENGGSADIKNMKGQTPLDIALGRFGMAEKEKVVKLLREHGNGTAN